MQIYAANPAGPHSYRWSGCAQPDQHQIDSDDAEFVCPFDLIVTYSYADAETDTQYANRVAFEFAALLNEKAARLAIPEIPEIPAAVAAKTVVLEAKVDLAEVRAAERAQLEAEPVDAVIEPSEVKEG